MSNIIHAEGLSKKYGSLMALNSLNLDVKKGEILGYLGPNGAGKTVTIRLLLGLIRPTAGHSEIFGLDSQKDLVSIHKRMAYVPGETALWPSLTGMETIELLGNLHGAYDASYRDK